jgi:mannose-6-phosphate isomerase-like protein (cupin superfamily)
LEGEGVLTTDDQKHLMRPNDYVYVPPGVRHSFANTGTNGLVFLVITTPTHDGEVL